MSLARLILPLLFACSLLLAQQGGVAHSLSHSLGTQQHEKHGSHPHYCELCALDAQLGSALTSSFFSIALALLPAITWTRCTASFQLAHSLPATARGPPAALRKFA